MDPFSIVPVITSLIGAYGSYKQYQDSKENAAEIERIAQQNARLMRMENAEVERRAKLEQEAVEGEARARSFASGYKSSESANLYIKGLEEEHDKQLDWLEYSGEKQVSIMLQESRLEADILRQQGKASLWNMASNVGMAAFYANEAGLFTTKADLLRDAAVFNSYPHLPVDNRLTILNPTYKAPTVTNPIYSGLSR